MQRPEDEARPEDHEQRQSQSQGQSQRQSQSMQPSPEDAAQRSDVTAQPEADAPPAATASPDAVDSASAAPMSASPVAEAPASAPSPTQPAADRLPNRHSDAPDRAADAAEENAAVLAQSRKHTRRSFAVAAAASAAGYLAYEWMEKLPGSGMQPAPYRRAFQANASLSRAVFQERALTPTYPLSRAETLRVNGVYGLKQTLDPHSYRLQLVGMREAAQHPKFVPDVTAWEYRYLEAQTNEDKGHDTKTAPAAAPAFANTAEKMAPEAMVEQEKQKENGTARMLRGREEAGHSHSTLPPRTPGLLLTMDDIVKLPRHELITQFKCIEGWSQIVQWAGVRMADFLEAYPPALINDAEPRYVYMETPDGDYYVGYDMEVCRHPQTLLVTEMMGAPLTQFHGAPLRVHMPTKYGYKQIKRVGLIRYTDSRPDDYWTKLGYDWYAGL